MKVDVAGWVYWKLGRGGEAGMRAAMCADALMLSEGAGGSGRRRVEVRWSELNDGKGRGVDARMREFVGKEALKEVESCMPKGGGSDRDVLLVRVMLSSGRDGGRIRMLEALVQVPRFTVRWARWARCFASCALLAVDCLSTNCVL